MSLLFEAFFDIFFVTLSHITLSPIRQHIPFSGRAPDTFLVLHVLAEFLAILPTTCTIIFRCWMSNLFLAMSSPAAVPRHVLDKDLKNTGYVVSA